MTQPQLKLVGEPTPTPAAPRLPWQIQLLADVVDGGVLAYRRPWETATFFLLVRYANADRQAWPALQTMAAALGVNERTIRRSIDGLVRAGLVRRMPHRYAGRTTRTYQLTLPDAPAPPVHPNRTRESTPTGHGSPPKKDRKKDRKKTAAHERTHGATVGGASDGPRPMIAAADAAHGETTPDPPNALFLRHAALAMLTDAGFSQIRAGELVRAHGPRVITDAVGQAHALQSAGKLKSSLAGCIAGLIRDGGWDTARDLIRKTAQDRARRAAAEQLAQEAAERQAAQEAAQARDAAWLEMVVATATPDALESARQRVLASHSPAMRQLLQDRPADHCSIIDSVVRELQGKP